MIISTTNPNAIQIITLIVSVFAPVLVGLVTRVTTSGATKAVLLALIAAIMGVLNGFLDSPSAFDLFPALINAVQVFTISVATYFGLWNAQTKNGNSVKAWAQKTLVK